MNIIDLKLLLHYNGDDSPYPALASRDADHIDAIERLQQSNLVRHRLDLSPKPVVVPRRTDLRPQRYVCTEKGALLAAVVSELIHEEKFLAGQVAKNREMTKDQVEAWNKSYPSGTVLQILQSEFRGQEGTTLNAAFLGRDGRGYVTVVGMVRSFPIDELLPIETPASVVLSSTTIASGAMSAASGVTASGNPHLNSMGSTGPAVPPEPPTTADQWKARVLSHTLMEVLESVFGERDYQDKKWPCSHHSVAEWLLIIEKLCQDARRAWVTGHGDNSALHEIRQITATGLACMEQCGAPLRGDPISPPKYETSAPDATEAKLENLVNDWNQRYPVGTKVTTSGLDGSSGTDFTSGPAFVLDDHPGIGGRLRVPLKNHGWWPMDWIEPSQSTSPKAADEALREGGAR